MTKDNMIFLGACSILGPSAMVAGSEEKMKLFAKNSLEWSKVLYEAQHERGIAAPPEPPTPVKTPYFVVEKRNYNGNFAKWSKTYTITGEFTSEEAADKAIDQFLSSYSGNGYGSNKMAKRFRVVRKER